MACGTRTRCSPPGCHPLNWLPVTGGWVQHLLANRSWWANAHLTPARGTRTPPARLLRPPRLGHIALPTLGRI